jgi:hypothetical protein
MRRAFPYPAIYAIKIHGHIPCRAVLRTGRDKDTMTAGGGGSQGGTEPDQLLGCTPVPQKKTRTHTIGPKWKCAPLFLTFSTPTHSQSPGFQKARPRRSLRYWKPNPLPCLYFAQIGYSCLLRSLITRITY